MTIAETPYQKLTVTLNEVVGMAMEEATVGNLFGFDPIFKINLIKARLDFLRAYLSCLFKADEKTPNPIAYPDWVMKLKFHFDLGDQIEEIANDTKELEKAGTPLLPEFLAQKNDVVELVQSSLEDDDIAAVQNLKQRFLEQQKRVSYAPILQCMN